MPFKTLTPRLRCYFKCTRLHSYGCCSRAPGLVWSPTVFQPEPRVHCTPGRDKSSRTAPRLVCVTAAVSAEWKRAPRRSLELPLLSVSCLEGGLPGRSGESSFAPGMGASLTQRQQKDVDIQEEGVTLSVTGVGTEVGRVVWDAVRMLLRGQDLERILLCSFQVEINPPQTRILVYFFFSCLCCR